MTLWKKKEGAPWWIRLQMGTLKEQEEEARRQGEHPVGDAHEVGGRGSEGAQGEAEERAARMSHTTSDFYVAPCDHVWACVFIAKHGESPIHCVKCERPGEWGEDDPQEKGAEEAKGRAKEGAAKE